MTCHSYTWSAWAALLMKYVRAKQSDQSRQTSQSHESVNIVPRLTISVTYVYIILYKMVEIMNLSWTKIQEIMYSGQSEHFLPHMWHSLQLTPIITGNQSCITFGEQTYTSHRDVKFVHKVCLTIIGFLKVDYSFCEKYPWLNNFETRIDPLNRLRWTYIIIICLFSHFPVTLWRIVNGNQIPCRPFILSIIGSDCFGDIFFCSPNE